MNLQEIDSRGIVTHAYTGYSFLEFPGFYQSSRNIHYGISCLACEGSCFDAKIFCRIRLNKKPVCVVDLRNTRGTMDKCKREQRTHIYKVTGTQCRIIV
jgi:hypothetical protein